MSEQNYPSRKATRLKGYDYSQTNAYFITICTHKHNRIFGDVIYGNESKPSFCRLSKYGEIAKQELLDLQNRYPHVTIDNYVIMPNHIHAIISLHESCEMHPNTSDIICAFKSLTTRKCRQNGFPQIPLFQTSYYDEIIRSKAHYQSSWQYIDNNPTKWSSDKYYKEQ